MTAHKHYRLGNRRPRGRSIQFAAVVSAFLVTACVPATMLSVVSGHAASLNVDGGVVQVLQINVPPPPPPGPLAACGNLSDYDNIVDGTERGDILIGTPGRDLLIGHGGNDLLLGGLGDDCLVGGAGNDLLYGHKGRDVLLGGDGHDLLFGGWGEDSLDGGDGHNACHGGLEVVNCVVGPAPGANTQTALEAQRELDPARAPEPDSDEAPPAPSDPGQPKQLVQPGDPGATGESSAEVPEETALGSSEEIDDSSSTADTSLSGADADLEASAA